MWWLRHKPGQWAAPCRDIANRRREILIVPTEDKRMALVVPPGEVAVLALLCVPTFEVDLEFSGGLPQTCVVDVAVYVPVDRVQGVA